MTQDTIYRSFAEAAQALGFDDLPADDAGSTAPELAPAPAPFGEPSASGVDIAARLDAAAAALATIARQDEEARALADRELASYDALTAALADAEAARRRAADVRARADELAGGAFADEARAAAERVAAEAAAAEEGAAALEAARRADVETFAAAHDLERLLADRRRRAAEEEARAARAARAERLAGALPRARKALAAGRFEEARAALEPVSNENPDDPEIASLLESMARRELERKAAEADDALWLARRERRHDPAAAVARLEALDVDGLPQPLAGHVFGCWAEACARLCRERGLVDPLRYAPTPGRGAVLARRGDGPHVVVSALGLPWRAGDPAPADAVRRARQLR